MPLEKMVVLAAQELNMIEIDSDVVYPPLLSKEEQEVINIFYSKNPHLKNIKSPKENLEPTKVYSDPWITTYTGKRFVPLNPTTESIDIKDIAHALSNICRFTGHSSEFYSVAQHSVLVSHLCNYENRLHGLLHDASEAYIFDCASPLKRSPEFEFYRKIEESIQNIIFEKFNLTNLDHDDVKRADILLLATEAKSFMIDNAHWELKIKSLPIKIEPLLPKEAEALFLTRFNECLK